MDSTPLVVNQIEDSRKLVEQLVSDGFDITIAFWIHFKFEEDGPWFYIVSRNVDQAGLQATYGAIRQALHQIPHTPWSSVSEFSELRLVGVNDPFAEEVLSFRALYPEGSRFKGVRIGNQLVEELYIVAPVTKSAAVTEGHGRLSINIGTAAEPEIIDLAKVPMVTILRDSAGPSKVVLLGGGKPERAMEGEEAQRFIAQFDAIRKQLE